MQKLFKTMTETNNKIQELKTYDKVIHGPIYGNKSQEAINKEL